QRSLFDHRRSAELRSLSIGGVARGLEDSVGRVPRPQHHGIRGPLRRVAPFFQLGVRLAPFGPETLVRLNSSVLIRLKHAMLLRLGRTPLPPRVEAPRAAPRFLRAWERRRSARRTVRL